MTISSAEFEQRTRRLREKMKAAGLDALIVFADEYRPGHATYLTGYKPINLIEESPQLVFLVGDEAPAMLIGRLNSYQRRTSSGSRTSGRSTGRGVHSGYLPLDQGSPRACRPDRR